MQFPITIGLRRSFLTVLLPLLALALVLTLAMLLPLKGWIRVAMALASLVGVAILIRQDPFRHRVQTLRLSPDGSLSLAFADAPDYFLPAIVQPGATVHPCLTVMRLKVDRKIYPVVLTSGSLAPEDFRRLRVFLRWSVKFSAPDAVV